MTLFLTYKHVFDNIIPIPWGNLAKNSDWKIENRWKLYHLSPYEHTIVMDAPYAYIRKH